MKTSVILKIIKDNNINKIISVEKDDWSSIWDYIDYCDNEKEDYDIINLVDKKTQVSRGYIIPIKDGVCMFHGLLSEKITSSNDKIFYRDEVLVYDVCERKFYDL